MLKALRSWWPRQTPALKTALTVGLAVISGGGITWIHATRAFLDDVLSWGIVVDLPAEPKAGDWGAQRFRILERSPCTLKIAATPPCAPGETGCYVLVSAKPAWWATWIAGLVAFGGAFFVAARFLAYRFLDPYKFIRGDALSVRVAINPDGSASETWSYSGVTSDNRRYAATVDYTYLGSDSAPPVIESFGLDCKDEHSIRPVFVDGLSCYRATIRFAEHAQQPYAFTITHRVSSPAWSRDVEEFEHRYRSSPTGEADGTDCWDYTAIHHWRRVEIQFTGLEHLSPTPYAVTQYPGRPEMRLADPEWKKEKGAWILRVEDVSPQATVSVRWKLQRRATERQSNAPSSSRS